jgi:hypothetical protein
MGRPDPRFAGVTLPTPEFADDDGGADPRLAAALQRHAAGAPVRYEVLVALATARLLVPVVAVLDSDHGDGPLREEKDSHMATVTLVNDDGRPRVIDLLVEVALDPEQAARLGEALAADATLRSCCQDGIAVTTR